VRFGAYHIYVPALLKPAARALASLLWALKQDNVDLAALYGAQHLAGSGRTSFPVDKALDRDAYRVLGYKQCGERAVRVDILERLADLIRPALSWRAGALGDKPAGAFDGRSFVVTQAMTSLTGSAGEDFASVLRALGYRMEKRPPLPPAPAPAAVEAPAEAAAVEAVAAEAGAETPLSETAGETSAAPQVLDETGAVAATVSVEAPAAENTEAAATPGETPEVLDESGAIVPEAALIADQAEPTQPDAAASAETGPATPVEPASEVVAAPELVEVWRPGGRSDERRPRHDRNRHRHQPAPQEGAAPAAVEGEPSENTKRERHGRGRRDRNKEFRKPRADAPAEAASAAPSAETPKPREPREDKGRPPREPFKGRQGRDRDKGKFAGKPREDRDNRSGPSHRPYASSAPRERDRPADPNSPFAKLAALKEQLAANKDR
jgi:ATP-dependent RNA helicase SUPV3L1/SUV3